MITIQSSIPIYIYKNKTKNQKTVAALTVTHFILLLRFFFVVILWNLRDHFQQVKYCIAHQRSTTQTTTDTEKKKQQKQKTEEKKQ